MANVLRATLEGLRSSSKIAQCITRYSSSITYPIEVDRSANVERESKWARPYEQIPGPKPMPLIGNIFRFLPYIGEYGDMELNDQMKTFRNQYGDIVKLAGVLNRRECVFLFDADLCEKIYRTEGKWPTRVAMEAMHRYRKERGMRSLTSQGEEWYEFRTKVNQHMMQPRTIIPHVKQIEDVATQMIERMRDLRDPRTSELPSTFNEELNKWALESISAIALDHRLGCLDPNLPEDSEPRQMINAVHEMFDLFYKLEILPSLWKLYDTRNLKRLYRVMDRINGILKKYIGEARERLRDSTESDSEKASMLSRLLAVDEGIAQAMALDMMTAGIDTTGNTAGSALYYIASNPKVHEKLHREAVKALPDKSSSITYDTFKEIPYIKACIKETLRMTPIAIGSLRTMREDIVFGGYRIPKDIDVIACHSVTARDAKHFPRPDEFIPERWTNDNDVIRSAKEAHPFAYMPFGFGPRTCIGRRFAQLEMETLLLKVLRNFRIEWHHEPMTFKSRFINTLGSPLRLKLIEI